MSRRYLSGIDVGTSCIKVMTGCLEEDGSISITGCGSAPTSGFIRGEVADAAALAGAVKSACDCARIAAGHPLGPTCLGVSGTFLTSVNRMGTIGLTYINGIRREDVDRARLAAVLTAVPYDRQMLHAVPVGYWTDGVEQSSAPLGQKANRLEVKTHIVSMPKSLHNELMASIAASGLELLGVAWNGLAGALSFPGDEACSVGLYLDIGDGTIDILLFRKQRILFSAVLPYGGCYITGDLMKVFGVTAPHAAEIKHYYSHLDKRLRGRDVVLDCNNYGTSDKNIAYDLLFDVIESRVSEVVSLIYEHLQPVLAGTAVQKIYLTGGSSLLPSFVERVGARFKAEVQVVGPLNRGPEYSGPLSTACDGVLRYAAMCLPQAAVSEPKPVTYLDKMKRALFS